MYVYMCIPCKWIIVSYVCISVNYALFLCVLGIIMEGPPTIIYFPGQQPIELVCNATVGVILWEVNGVSFSLTRLREGGLANHNASGTNIIINVPANNTEYVCTATTNENEMSSKPAFVYIAGTYMYVHSHVAIINARLHVCRYIGIYVICNRVCKNSSYLCIHSHSISSSHCDKP